MPTAEHESPVALAKLDPDLVAWLLTDLFMIATAEEYRSELFRELATRNQQIGEARGEARGEGQAVLTVLAARGVPVPEPVREQILACTDLAQLDIWLRRAVTVTAVEQLFR